MLNKVTVPLKNLSVSKFNHKNRINRKYRHTHTHTHTHTQVCIYEEVGRRKREKETDLLQEIVEAG